MSLAHLFPGVSCIEIVVDNAHSHNVTNAVAIGSRIQKPKAKCSRWESNPKNPLGVSPTRRARADWNTRSPSTSPERGVSRWESQPPTKTLSHRASHKQLHPQTERMTGCPSRGRGFDSCPTLPSRLDCCCHAVNQLGHQCRLTDYLQTNCSLVLHPSS
jgi:hypothetical protein